ncbi:nuclear transport factor 2 family protein [Stenotrophomonas sp.]|uniref:nuclear transport factor 2 family protein n=1 Tax=Stenotrophomonas sp. TaxID=69392 RepID=UPI00289BFF5A|nr:nuclear transport factor 2 family protein [Stenotrophomonas sp.]
MMHSRDHVLQRALAVLDWNRRNLNTASVLDEAAVGECFADHFVVEPNGRRYEATRATYLAFLNGMKAGMRGIDYDVLHTLVDAQSVALSILAHISHDDDRRETFQAMLLMQFDNHGKITLWHEVYVPQPPR